MIVEKFVEVRDAATTIPCIAFKVQAANAREIAMMARGGYSPTLKEQMEYVFLMKIDGLEVRDDPFEWSSGARTMKLAHMVLYGPMFTKGIPELAEARVKGLSFDELPQEGALIDVEYCLGVRETPKLTEFGG